MEKFQNKYRIASTRAQWWDYGAGGTYFITICTENRKHYFGEIKSGKMLLSNLGIIADLLWHEMPKYNTGIKLGEYVVMPDHIHGILILPEKVIIKTKKEATAPESLNDALAEISNTKDLKMSSISPKPKTIPSIIRSYKSAVTKHANRLNLENGWQSRYYDQIIRSQNQFQNVTNYIKNNVSNWK